MKASTLVIYLARWIEINKDKEVYVKVLINDDFQFFKITDIIYDHVHDELNIETEESDEDDTD